LKLPSALQIKDIAQPVHYATDNTKGTKRDMSLYN